MVIGSSCEFPVKILHFHKNRIDFSAIDGADVKSCTARNARGPYLPGEPGGASQPHSSRQILRLGRSPISIILRSESLRNYGRACATLDEPNWDFVESRRPSTLKMVPFDFHHFVFFASFCKNLRFCAAVFPPQQFWCQSSIKFDRLRPFLVIHSVSVIFSVFFGVFEFDAVRSTSIKFDSHHSSLVSRVA